MNTLVKLLLVYFVATLGELGHDLYTNTDCMDSLVNIFFSLSIAFVFYNNKYLKDV